MAAEIVVANTTAIMSYEGRTLALRRGVTTARADHPIVQEHPEMFSPLPVHFEVEEAEQAPAKTTETTTAAPGEKRTVSSVRRTARPTR